MQSSGMSNSGRQSNLWSFHVKRDIQQVFSPIKKALLTSTSLTTNQWVGLILFRTKHKQQQVRNNFRLKQNSYLINSVDEYDTRSSSSRDESGRGLITYSIWSLMEINSTFAGSSIDDSSRNCFSGSCGRCLWWKRASRFGNIFCFTTKASFISWMTFKHCNH